MEGRLRTISFIFYLACSLCLSGCSFSSTEADESDSEEQEELLIYDFNEDSDYLASSEGSDYFFQLSDYWQLDESSDNFLSTECFRYTNESNNDVIYVMKNAEDLSGEEGYENSLQCKDIPQFMYDTMDECGIDISSLVCEESHVDYSNVFKTLHEEGTCGDIFYQALYFQSYYYIEGEWGGYVPNCIMIIYENEDNSSSVSDFLEDMLQTMDYIDNIEDIDEE